MRMLYEAFVGPEIYDGLEWKAIARFRVRCRACISSTGFYRLQGSWVRVQGLRVITIIIIDPHPQARRLKRMTATGTSTQHPAP